MNINQKLLLSKMKKLIRIIIVVVILLITSFSYYVYKLHSLAVEGNKIFEQRCLVVNPLLIKTRKTHLSLGAAIDGKIKPSLQEFESELLSLPKYADSYLEAEKSWLDKEGSYINRWDFKLFEPGYLKTAAKYQLSMYQGYYDYYKVVGDFFGRRFPQGQDPIPLMDKYWNDVRTNRDLYNQAMDKGVSINDWRKIFGNVPVPAGCTDENVIIPDTTGAMNMEPTPIPTKEPRITG